MGQVDREGLPPHSHFYNWLFHFATALFTIPFAGQCLFYTLLLARFQVERMAFDIFDNVFRLNLALETA